MQGKASKILAVALSVLLLSACEGGAEDGLTAEERSKAEALFKTYDAARSSGNPEAAEAAADKLRERYPESDAAQRLEATLESVRQAAEALRETRRLQGLWDYQANAVDGGTQRTATIFSRTVDAGDDAPAPIPDGQLVLRDHPSWGRSAYLLLQQKNFDCGKPCTLRISFDGAPATEWQGKQADSGKGPALFVEDEATFLQQMQAAKKVRFELPKGSGRIPVLEFEVGGFAPASYASP